MIDLFTRFCYKTPFIRNFVTYEGVSVNEQITLENEISSILRSHIELELISRLSLQNIIIY